MERRPRIFYFISFCINLASCSGKAGAGVCACWKREPEEWRAASEPGSHLQGWLLSIAGQRRPLDLLLFGLRKCEQSGLSIVHNLPILWCDCPLVSVGAASADPTNGRLRILKNKLCLSRPNTDLSHFSLHSTIKQLCAYYLCCSRQHR